LRSIKDICNVAIQPRGFFASAELASLGVIRTAP